MSLIIHSISYDHVASFPTIPWSHINSLITSWRTSVLISDLSLGNTHLFLPLLSSTDDVVDIAEELLFQFGRVWSPWPVQSDNVWRLSNMQVWAHLDSRTHTIGGWRKLWEHQPNCSELLAWWSILQTLSQNSCILDVTVLARDMICNS